MAETSSRPQAVQGTLAEAAGEESGYSGPQVCKLVGITYRQLDYWDRTDLLKPSLSPAHGSGSQRRYSYLDLVQLKTIKGLLDAGVKLQAARKAIESLRSARGKEWQTASIVLNGSDSVLARDGDHLVDLVRGGQGVLNVVPIAHMVEELDAAIVRLAPRPSETAAETAVADSQAAQGG
jgi:DNA-binding transcriptional MerR regulator